VRCHRPPALGPSLTGPGSSPAGPRAIRLRRRAPRSRAPGGVPPRLGRAKARAVGEIAENRQRRGRAPPEPSPDLDGLIPPHRPLDRGLSELARRGVEPLQAVLGQLPRRAACLLHLPRGMGPGQVVRTPAPAAPIAARTAGRRSGKDRPRRLMGRSRMKSFGTGRPFRWCPVISRARRCVVSSYRRAPRISTIK